MSLLDGGALRVSRAALTGLMRRHEAVAANIANIDTPGYRRREVNFEGALRASIERDATRPSLAVTNPRHFTSGGGPGTGALNEPTTRDLIAGRNDDNTVSIDEEMALLAETQIRFQALSQTVGRRLSTLRSVIRGI